VLENNHLLIRCRSFGDLYSLLALFLCVLDFMFLIGAVLAGA